MKKRVFSCIMALALVLTAMFPASAATTSSIGSECEGLIPIEETGMTREEAIELLGLSEEEAEGMSFYGLNPLPRATITINPGDVVHVDTITVNGGISYGNMIKINGKRIAWAVTAGNFNNKSTTVSATLKQIGVGPLNNGTITLSPSNTKVTRGFQDITENSTVQFEFYCPSGISATFGTVVGVSG